MTTKQLEKQYEDFKSRLWAHIDATCDAIIAQDSALASHEYSHGDLWLYRCDTGERYETDYERYIALKVDPSDPDTWEGLKRSTVSRLKSLQSLLETEMVTNALRL